VGYFKKDYAKSGIKDVFVIVLFFGNEQCLAVRQLCCIAVIQIGIADFLDYKAIYTVFDENDATILLLCATLMDIKGITSL
jgi:hypothetical protein